MSGYMIYMSQTQYNDVVADFWLDMRRTELQNILRSDRGWTNIINDNPQMACLVASPPGCPAWGNPNRADENIRIRIGDNIWIDGNSPSMGMTRSGDFCNTFNPNKGDSRCIYGISVRWRALCANAACANPEPRVKIEFRQSETGGGAQKLERSNFSFLRNQKLNTLSEICASITGDPSDFNAPGTCNMGGLSGSCDAAAGFYLTGFDNNGMPVCSTMNMACASPNEVLYGFDAAGNPQCVQGCTY